MKSDARCVISPEHHDCEHRPVEDVAGLPLRMMRHQVVQVPVVRGEVLFSLKGGRYWCVHGLQSLP